MTLRSWFASELGRPAILARLQAVGIQAVGIQAVRLQAVRLQAVRLGESRRS